MHFFKTLQMYDPNVTSDRCKIHFACWNGVEDPLDVYLAGRFDEWQSWQNKKNFECDLVVSLIELPEPNRWLFAGVHEVNGSTLLHNRGRNKDREMYRYSMRRIESTDPLCGRLIASFEKNFRNPYLRGKRWESAIKVAEMRAERLQVAEFPGYVWTMLTKQQLDTVVKQQNPSWRSALINVAGVYVIADRETGKLYVGSATGESGIWGRWSSYAKTGHGGNKELRKLLRDNGAEYAENFQYGVLETADTRASDEDILARESHWKDLLLSRSHGHNAN